MESTKKQQKKDNIAAGEAAPVLDGDFSFDEDF